MSDAESHGAGFPAPQPGLQLARNTAVMAAGTLLSRLTGFGRLVALAFAFGVVEGRLADAYNLGNVAPNILYELVLGGVLSSVLIPVFVETLQRDPSEHRHVVNTVTTLAGIGLVALSVLGIVAAPALAALFTIGAEGSPGELAAMREVVTLFLRLFLPQVFFYGLTTIYTAYLNSHRHFAAPMFAPVLNNLLVIAVLLAFAAAAGSAAVDLAALTTAQLVLLGAGTTAGIVAMTLPLWPVARRHGWHWRPSLDWRHPMVVRIARLGGWAALYVIINQLGYLVVILLAPAVVGGYAAYTYAFVFFQLPHGVYAVSVMTALVPAMSAAASAGDLVQFRDHLARGVQATALLIVPAAVGLGVLAFPIVRLALEQGVFTAASTTLVARVLTAFAFGLVSFSLFQLFLRAHYALQDTRTPVLINLAAVGLNIVVDLALFALLPSEWKIAGLAVGHATAYTLGAALFAIRLRRRVGGLGGRQTLSGLARILAAAAVMGLLVWATAGILAATLGTSSFLGQSLQVAAAILVGLASYILAAKALNVTEMAAVGGIIKRRLGRGHRD